jgi:lipopolysaccharide export system permease protein
MNLLDRYILRQFISTLFFAIIALCLIFLVVNLMENLDDFIDKKVPNPVIIKYYISFFPEILKILTPVSVLIATLFSIGKLSTNNEITAMKSGGLSLYRLMLPMVAFAIVLSLLQLYFNGWIVPVANQTKLEIERVYLKKAKAQGGSLFNLFFRDTPTKNVMMQYYHSSEKSGYQVAIEEYTDELSPRLRSRIEANRIVWQDGNWQLQDGIIRTFSNNSVFVRSFDTLDTKLNIKHNQLIKLQMLPDEMTFDEKRDYIKVLKMGGQDIRKNLIDYYAGFAFPFANLIVMLFGVPFASVKKRGGIAIQITAAMVTAFTYLIFTEISKTLGYSMNLNPILVGWSANLIFFLASIVVLIKTQK